MLIEKSYFGDLRDYLVRTNKESEYREALYDWFVRMNCCPPAPNFIKQIVLLRHGLTGATWVETGTYIADTTSVLCRVGKTIHTIEPSKECLELAQRKLAQFDNVVIHEGTSEICLPILLPKLSGDICFWLDGHYSGDITFHGDSGSPIRTELELIRSNLSNLGSVVIMIDDIRCSHGRDVPDINTDNYPPLDFYVDWASKAGLNWTIELDIFIAKSRGLDMYSSE